VGVDSTPVILLTAWFTGMVLALQTFSTLKRVHAEGYVGTLVALSMVRELGACSRRWCSPAARGRRWGPSSGTMRVTEQIDALEVLATDPVHFLVVPRVWATTIMLPLLVALGDAIGIVGGYRGLGGTAGRQPGVVHRQHLPLHGASRTSRRARQGCRLRPAHRAHRLPAGAVHAGGAEGVGRADDSSGGARP
jgi:phospholipid/cholesterol/gamma-HCH transport system permease protein